MTEATRPASQAQTEPTPPRADSPDTMDTTSDKLVPVSEAIRYRRRAQSAEQQLEQRDEQMRALSTRLDEANQTIADLERRQRVDSLLTEADAIDLEAARLLTEQAVRLMDEPDVQQAVEDLRRHKPYLFRRRLPQASSAMAPTAPDGASDPVHEAAEEASRSGDRRDLLRYLRLRRSR